ncbi:TPA: DNA mismatch repair protein MutT [Candidatus Dependentiae bacterium]|nr:DNA mismatch repair protein MutT [Candidatus Dependentiae bacterium]HBZ72975.1 DNA mismatch repair protein MutT [Candidatus Dependentiae bacterium]
MIKVKFHDLNSIEDHKLTFAAICAEHKSMWIWCKNKNRAWEIPGGRREPNENILDTAKRELYEETGAKEFELTALFEYSVTINDITTFGRIFYAEIQELGDLPSFEIEKIELLNIVPTELSFPKIQPLVFEEAKKRRNSF